MWNQIAQEITQATKETFEIEDCRSVGGGCINQGYKLIGKNRNYFLKVNQPNKVDMFVAEALGLKEMLATQTILIPEVICWGMTDRNSYIVLEWLDLGNRNSQGWSEMGRKLAKMHRFKVTNNKFGWSIDNTIGSTPQLNNLRDNWADFFAQYRIGYQLKLAKRKGGSFSNIDKVVEKVRELLSQRLPQVSIVHGDLWSGNADLTVDGQPVIFDPATYYGDREVDIAMTELFGGFPANFYRGYNQEWPLDKGYSQRKKIYNLYHILNHFNLFGGGYASQASNTIDYILNSKI